MAYIRQRIQTRREQKADSMSTAQPQSPATLTAVSVDEVLQSILFIQKTPKSAAQLASQCRSYLSTEAIKSSLARLIAQGQVNNEAGKLQLTATGRAAVAARYGGRYDDNKLKNVIWPARVLGLDPMSKAASRLSRPDTLRAVLLSVLYQLPVDTHSVTQSQALAALMTRGLASQVRVMPTQAAVKALAATLNGLDDAQKLRRAVLRVGLALGAESGRTSDTDIPQPSTIGEFAQRVQTLTESLTTPPLSRAVAIAQVYDAYGRDYPDAGSLAEFKQRLLSAHKARLLKLQNLDEPDALEQALRKRSEIQGEQSRYHLILRGGS